MQTARNKRIAVTGMGAVTPLGESMERTWDSLVRGVSGIGPITRFDPADLPCRIAGQVPELPALQGIRAKEIRRLDPYVRLALHASDQALRNAGLAGSDWDPERAGVVLGSSRGGIATVESNARAMARGGFRALSPHLTVSSLINQAPAAISRRHGLLGPCLALSTACASGAHAVGQALGILRAGLCDVLIAGGAEAPLTPLIVGGFARARALSRRNHDPARAMRPFDRDRDGFVLSEGAAVMVLEEWNHAVRRGARILGEVLGFGMTADAYHMTAPHPQGLGLARAVRLALADAGLGPDEIDMIHAHGTATRLNDRIEAQALHRGLGPRAREIPVAAVKSMTGHMLGASGAFEAMTAVTAARKGRIPPILNLDHPDPACDLNLVRGAARQAGVSTVLCTSLAFGGMNAALIVRGFPG